MSNLQVGGEKLKKYPFVKQENLKDCGPACLSMIIQYYKGYVGLEKLRYMLKTSKDGTSAYHIIETANNLGFDASGIKCTFEELKSIPLPCIAHVTLDHSYKHYITIYKIDYQKNRIYIADPSTKLKWINFEEFNSIWNNIIIVLYPIKKITLEKEISIKDFIKQLFYSFKNQLLQILLISIVVTLLSIMTTLYFKYIISATTQKSIIFIFVIFALIYLLKLISDYLRNKLLITVNQKIDLLLTTDSFKKIILLPYHFYCNKSTGEVVTRLNDISLIKDNFSKIILNIFIDLPLTIISLFCLYFINETLFFISLIILILYLIISYIFKNAFIRYIDEYQNLKETSNSYMVEGISGFETIKGINCEKKIIEKFENKYIGLSEKKYAFENYYNKLYILKEIIDDFGFLIIIFIGCLLMNDNVITIGQLLTFNALFGYFLSPIRNIIDSNTQIKEVKNALKRLLNLFVKEEKQGLIDKNMKGDILFKNLNFSYNDKDNILNNINLKIKDKNKVMVIGSSGSGKSTLFKLLKKYYKINRDSIYINNIDINDYQYSDVIYISQNEILFTDTMKNNITLENDDILKVSKMCYVDEIVKNSDLGFNMLIEENGFNLSGGEKQRVVLARALLRPFNILIIDEGFGEMDTNLERKILKNIFDYYKEKTIIIISHRYDNMDLFDQVITIEKSEVKDVSKNG